MQINKIEAFEVVVPARPGAVNSPDWGPAVFDEAAKYIDIWHGSGIDLGLLDASYVHAAACAETCTLGSDIVGYFIRTSDLLQESLQYADGCVRLPDGPGLGVDLDLDTVYQFAHHYWTTETGT